MRIAVYNDSVVFGGHEIMSLHGLRALLNDGHELFLLFTSRNRGYAEAVRGLAAQFPQQVCLAPMQIYVQSGQVLRTWSNWRALLRLAAVLRSSRCNRLLVLQGDIEQGSYALVAAALIRMPCVSYIPMIMSGVERGIRFAQLRDWLSTPFYRLPQKFIVISSHFAASAALYGANKAVVVFNAVDETFFRRRARVIGDLRRDRLVVGIFGRISYQQKGIDTALSALASDPSLRQVLRLLIVGDGPDSDRLTMDCKRLELEHCVERRPWNGNMSAVYDEVDLVLLPSNFEGVPLVVLEALAKGLPVIASRLPGFEEFLSQASMFERGDAMALAARLREFSQTSHPHPGFGKASDFDIDRCRMARFSAAFVAAVCAPQVTMQNSPNADEL